MVEVANKPPFLNHHENNTLETRYISQCIINFADFFSGWFSANQIRDLRARTDWLLSTQTKFGMCTEYLIASDRIIYLLLPRWHVLLISELTIPRKDTRSFTKWRWIRILLIAYYLWYKSCAFFGAANWSLPEFYLWVPGRVDGENDGFRELIRLIWFLSLNSKMNLFIWHQPSICSTQQS